MSGHRYPRKIRCHGVWCLCLLALSGCAVSGTPWIGPPGMMHEGCPSCGLTVDQGCRCLPDPWSHGYHCTVWRPLTVDCTDPTRACDHDAVDPAAVDSEILPVQPQASPEVDALDPFRTTDSAATESEAITIEMEPIMGEALEYEADAPEPNDEQKSVPEDLQPSPLEESLPGPSSLPSGDEIHSVGPSDRRQAAHIDRQRSHDVVWLALGDEELDDLARRDGPSPLHSDVSSGESAGEGGTSAFVRIRKHDGPPTTTLHNPPNFRAGTASGRGRLRWRR